MPLSCPRCQRRIDVLGQRPSFCPYCGQALSGSTGGNSFPGSTEPGADETVDYQNADATVAVVGEAPPGAAVPDMVAGYRLIRKLGQGGMGSVHEAEEVASGRRVALKLMAPEHAASRVAVERFLQEGRLASAIAHPRCVFVLAADQSADGWPFLVMELMPGHTLKDLVQEQGPLPQDEAVRTILDVVEGLQEAHKLGVIHRDVKPSNCFLDAEGRVKVGDFGLSKSLLGSDADLTRTGAFLGTPHYASPEQIKGEPIDARSDVYSVAATLYYLLTGGPPHQSGDATSTLAKIVTEEAPPVRSIRPEVWSALEQVVMRGLERDRRRRYRDLEEFRESLAPFLPGRVVWGRFGLRVAAYALDFLLTTSFITLAMVIEGLTQRENETFFSNSFSGGHNTEVFTGLVVFLYYALSEVFGHASPGKRILRLRVVSSRRGGTASWAESIARVLIFAAIVIAPRRIYTLGLAHRRDGLGTILSIGTLIQLASIPVLFVTARAKNGYRGLHELLSGTAVVYVAGSNRRRGRSGRGASEGDPDELRLTRPEGLPDSIGPYRVRGALAWERARRVVLGEDEGLGRAVWIVLRPAAAETTSEPRRDVGRLARPRWLGAGELDGWSWEAFVAPGGQPLPDFVRHRGRLGWHAAREVLEDLAAELAAACDDGTLPEGLAARRVWVQPDGRVFLIDGLIDPHSGPSDEGEVPGDDPQRRALELLRRVAHCALGGGACSAEGSPVGSPVPGHAIAAMERLCGQTSPYATVAGFLVDLDSTREASPELTDLQKFAHAAYVLIATEIKTWLLLLLTVAYYIFLAYLASEKLSDLKVPDDVLDRVFLFQATLWVLLAMILREGIGGLLLGVTVVRTNGRRASRLRLAWREALRWLPVIAISELLEALPASEPYGPLREYGPTVALLILPFFYVLPALFLRGRYLNDLIARTAVVPK